MYTNKKKRVYIAANCSLIVVAVKKPNTFVSFNAEDPKILYMTSYKYPTGLRDVYLWILFQCLT